MRTDRIDDLKILIADDHYLIRQFVSNALQDAKVVDVQMASDGNEAIRLMKNACEEKRPFDVLFLDSNMPNISGLEVLTFLRTQPEFSNTAIVMLTADSEQTNIVKAIQAGATSYMVKPVTAAHVCNKLAQVSEWINQKGRTENRVPA